MRYWNITDCVFEQTTVNKGSGTAIYLRGEGSIVSAGYGHRVTGLAERDGRIQRLQREVADKTERLGRLAREVGELKARVLR